MRRIASGTTDQYVYFQRQTGLSSFTVYRSRNGAAWAAMTTPTISEGDSVNAPGIYELLLDEDMTLAAGNTTEHMALYVTHAGMSPVFLEVELFRPVVTEGQTLAVTSSVASANAVQISGDSTAADNAEAFFDGTGYAGTNNVIPTVTTVNGLAANVITATAINADAFTAAKFASDVTTELQSGLATAAELAKVPKSDSNVTWNATALASINTQADTALSDYDPPTNAEMVARTLAAASYATATALQTVDDEVAVIDGNVDAIQTKTDSLTFTVAGQVDANAESMNGAEILGVGTSGNKWRGE